MAKIYASPKEIEAPEYQTYQDTDEYLKAGNEYVEKLKEWAKENSNCPEAGKEIRFPAADGYARYIVFSLKPVTLIHVDVGDAWHFQYANRLTAADIRKEVKKVEGLAKLFGTKK